MQLIPGFIKDVDVRGIHRDIRQILSDNPIKDPQAKQDGAEHEYAVGLLDVIGFDPRHEMAGTEVCPIFQDRNQHNLIIFPPFSLKGERVVGGRIGSIGEFVVLESRRCIIEIKTPFPAKPDFILWVDEKLALHYELRLY